MTGPRILVLEDESLIAAATAALLEEWGYQVVGPARTVRAALALIAASPPDGALLDVHLDEETSEAVAEALTRLGRPFLTTTAYASHHIPPVLARAPLIRKPVNEAKLKRALEALLDRQQARAPAGQGDSAPRGT